MKLGLSKFGILIFFNFLSVCLPLDSTQVQASNCADMIATLFGTQLNSIHQQIGQPNDFQRYDKPALDKDYNRRLAIIVKILNETVPLIFRTSSPVKIFIPPKTLTRADEKTPEEINAQIELLRNKFLAYQKNQIPMSELETEFKKLVTILNLQFN